MTRIAEESQEYPGRWASQEALLMRRHGPRLCCFREAVPAEIASQGWSVVGAPGLRLLKAEPLVSVVRGSHVVL